MDSVVAQLLARLNMFLTQELDFPIDMERFASEPRYATQVLELADEMDNYEFKAIAAQIRRRRLEQFSLRHLATPEEGDVTALRPEGETHIPAPQKQA